MIIVDIKADFGAALGFIEKTRSANKKIPIIVATSDTSQEKKILLLEKLVDDYLIKPFIWEELMVRIKSIFRRIYPYNLEVNKWLDYGLIKLNPSTHVVLVKEKEIRLRLKEFLILKYFLEHRGKIITREELLDHVWDENVDLFSNAVNVHLSNLRKKLKEKLPDTPVIKTIHGKGFRILNEFLAWS
jgi:DNA-binding response OmpR family regulator